MSRKVVWLIRFIEILLVTVAATVFESNGIAIVGGFSLGILWAYNDRALNDKIEKP